MRIGDGGVVQVEADDGVGPAVEFASERGPLYFGHASHLGGYHRLAQGAVGEQQFQ
jgi:hypothetical protein